MDGQPAPTFSLPDQNGETHSLEDYAGRWLVLYFYPKDGTPLCTAEACYFRDEQSSIASFDDAAVVGISMDTPTSHKLFAEEHQLNFPLLSDPDHVVTEAYGCWQPEDTPDREYLGIVRSTFLISPEGVIAKSYRQVTPEGHAEQIIHDLQALQHSSAAD